MKYQIQSKTAEEADVLEFSIKELFSDSGTYVIPVYQRNYAWGEAEIMQLIQDIVDSLKQGYANYYLGTLVVFEREGSVFETIDGQQRLTTLSILMSVLKNDWQESIGSLMDWLEQLNLDFKSRKSSSVLLNRLFTHGNLKGLDYNKGSNIATAYDLTKKLLKKLLQEEEVSIESFTAYLLSNVKILRVPVPYDTDLNHYFEIMNTRGEQLEKHEIVKAKLLAVFTALPDEKREKFTTTFNSVWNATSDMERYLQYGFTTDQRDRLFNKSEWNNLQVNNFQELNDAFEKVEGESSDKKTIAEILEGKRREVDSKDPDDNPVRFHSVVNFENFLLHVLRLMNGAEKDIPLDDKRLIAIFEEELNTAEDKVQFVKDFCFELLRTKFFFDQYIIKREFIGGHDHWSLKRLKRYEGSNVSYVNTFGAENDTSSKSVNRQLLMLLSMFHVSTPTMVYKHWLSAALKYPFNEAEKDGSIHAEHYKNHLENIARSFVFARHLRSENSYDYHNMIFRSDTIPAFMWEQVDEEKLTFGNISNNLVFNYIDYLYWSSLGSTDVKISNFEFSPRSSVEHYYPRNPAGNLKKLSTEEEVSALNCIGNLCLISHNKNSRYSNFSPGQKIELSSKRIDSIKQYLMMQIADAEKWDVSEIQAHDKEVKELLKNNLL